MGIFSKIAKRMPRGLAVAMMSLGGLFGMRTPPDPPVTAQTSPARGPEGVAPPVAGAGGGAADGPPPEDARPMRRGPRAPGTSESPPS